MREPTETILPSGIIIPDLRDLLERMRRHPAHCLYCAEIATSNEHVVPEALGGRLTAKILCSNHNGLIGRTADEQLIEELHSCAHFLGVRRQRADGTELRGRTDDGDLIKFTSEGVPKRRTLEVIERSEGKIRRARGSLAKLDTLRAQGALAAADGPTIAYLEHAPPVTISMSIGADAEKAVLKIALHFLAGFVSDIDLDVAANLLPYITGEKAAGGKYVRTLSLEGRFFPSSWPPVHIVAAYPTETETFVTVLLFGLYGFNVRLPILVPDALRYIQNLVTDDVNPVLEWNDYQRDFGWDDRLGEADLDALRSNVQWRHDYIMNVGLHRSLRRRCQNATKAAYETMLATGNDMLISFRDALPMEGFTSDQISVIMYYASAAWQSGRPIWDLPAEIVF